MVTRPADQEVEQGAAAATTTVVRMNLDLEPGQVQVVVPARVQLPRPHGLAVGRGEEDRRGLAVPAVAQVSLGLVHGERVDPGRVRLAHRVREVDVPADRSWSPASNSVISTLRGSCADVPHATGYPANASTSSDGKNRSGTTTSSSQKPARPSQGRSIPACSAIPKPAGRDHERQRPRAAATTPRPRWWRRAPPPRVGSAGRASPLLPASPSAPPPNPPGREARTLAARRPDPGTDYQIFACAARWCGPAFRAGSCGTRPGRRAADACR